MANRGPIKKIAPIVREYSPKSSTLSTDARYKFSKRNPTTANTFANITTMPSINNLVRKLSTFGKSNSPHKLEPWQSFDSKPLRRTEANR